MTAVPLSAMSIGARERAYVLDAIDTTMLSSAGPFVPAFEKELGKRTGTANVVATSTGTCALEIALRALGVGPGDEVIVPALTFVSAAAAVTLVGAVPVVVDVSEDTWTIDPDAVRRSITSRTKAIIAVDVLGHPADYDALAEFGLPIVQDGAEAIGAFYKGRPVGSCGSVAIFSFHANKAVATGEGGCLLTNDAALGARARQLSAFGMSPTRRYWHEVPGHNHRMSNLTAAIGLAQMERWVELIAGRRRVAAHYDAALAGLPLERRPVARWATESVWLYTVRTRRRADLLEACGARGIDARAIWPSVPEQPAFRNAAPRACPVARDISETALWLPTWAGMSSEDLDRVVSALHEALNRGGRRGTQRRAGGPVRRPRSPAPIASPGREPVMMPVDAPHR